MNNLVFRQEAVRSVIGDSKVPFKKLDREDLYEILRLLFRAFDAVKSKFCDVLTYSEDEISILMQRNIRSIISNDEMLIEFIQQVHRSSSCVNYNGVSKNVSPDIIFELNIGGFKFDFVIEAKILDRTKKGNLNRYCAKGINRFISGLYAWHLSEAIMIAYIRDGSNLCSVLNRYFTSGTPPRRNNYNVKRLAIPCKEFEGDVSCTIHNRKFRYIVEPFNKAGPIELWHVGLS